MALRGGEHDLLDEGLDLADLRTVSSLTFASTRVLAAGGSEGEYLLLPLPVSTLLDGEGGGLGLSISVGLYLS